LKPTAGEAVDRHRGRWRWGRIPASAAALLLIERQLVTVMGTPSAQVRTLRDLGLSPTDPVTPLLAVLAFLCEALIGYVLVVLVLRTLSLLPGAVGSLTGRATVLLSPGAVRKLLDLLVGGTLLAQATLTAMPSAPLGSTPDSIHTMATAPAGSIGPVGSIAPTGPTTRMEPAATRPPSRRLAAPPPPWLGGGPSKPRVGYTIEPGDTLWDIAATHLEPAPPSPARVNRYWRQIYRANRRAIGADPDLIHPGTRLDVPSFRGQRR
jgi:LysM domain